MEILVVLIGVGLLGFILFVFLKLNQRTLVTRNLGGADEINYCTGKTYIAWYESEPNPVELTWGEIMNNAKAVGDVPTRVETKDGESADYIIEAASLFVGETYPFDGKIVR